MIGVKSVTSQITTKSRAAKPDAIKHKIEDALRRATDRELSEIKVEVQGNKVTLSGTVRSYAEMEDIRGAAWSAPGVTDLENNLRVGYF